MSGSIANTSCEVRILEKDFLDITISDICYHEFLTTKLYLILWSVHIFHEPRRHIAIKAASTFTHNVKLFEKLILCRSPIENSNTQFQHLNLKVNVLLCIILRNSSLLRWLPNQVS